MKFNLPPYSKLIIKLTFFSLVIMSGFRLFLFVMVHFTWLNKTNYSFFDLLTAFVLGLRYDLVVTGYILSVPLLILGLAAFFTNKIAGIVKGVFVYLAIVCFIVLLILSSDIPYFLQFYTRLTTASLQWVDDSKYMFSMILSEVSFVLYLIIFIVLSILAVYFLWKEKKRFLKELSERNIRYTTKSFLINLTIFLIMLAGLLIAIRGRISQKSPIRIGTAYFSNHQLLNKLALNPVFTFGHSLKNDLNAPEKLNWMDQEVAAQLADSLLKLPESDTFSLMMPLKWRNSIKKQANTQNVVLIIMESMGSFKLGAYNGPKNLTPNLDRIIHESIYFDQIYSAGIHTFNGIYSTLYSFPAIYKQQPLEELMDVPQNGIANVLQSIGYSTLYFTTHDPQFDNVSGFLMANGFGKIYSEQDYPGEWNRSTNGVSDHRMFEFAVPVLTDLSKRGNPFFVTFMTASDHKPFVIPEDINFTPKAEEMKDKIVEYADWSIGFFLKQASKQDWYRNTTFVFVADHGLNMGHTYDMPLSFHHIPFIIYTPAATQISDTLHQLGGQIDVAPTLLGLLDIPFKNNTMGVNLFKYKRPFMYFCADDKLGCLDKSYYLIIRPDSIETLYRYQHLKTDNYLESYPFKADSMKQYMFSMMQTAQQRMKQRHLPVTNANQ